MFINYYEILEVECTASDEKLKRAFRLNAVKYHPDKNSDDPYFSQKFIEIKAAYDILINPEKRIKFDLIYYQKFPKSSQLNPSVYNNRDGKQEYEKDNQYESKQRAEKIKQDEEKFKYDPYKHFYSESDRDLNDTPQFEPQKTPWGDNIEGLYVFFKLPKQIGKIIGGYSSFVKGAKKMSFTKLFFTTLLGSYISIPIIGVIIFLIWNKWHNYLHQPDATQKALMYFAITTAILIILKMYSRYNLVAFNHLNYYVGINGFALFKAEGDVGNITSEQEINFSNITDLYTVQTINKINFSYVDTRYEFLWINSTRNKVEFSTNKTFRDEKGNPDKIEFPDYWMNKYAEKYWTIYLLDKMDSHLQKFGFILFKIYTSSTNLTQNFIKLGIGYITFLKPGGQEFTYKFSDIKKIYIKGRELRIQHKNFERALFFFRTGNEDSIPLTYLCNREFFLKSIEILLGTSIK